MRNQEIIKTFNSVLGSFWSLNNEYINYSKHEFDNLFNFYLSNTDKNKLSIFFKVLDEFKNALLDTKRNNRKQSIEFNALSFFKIDEPKHSSLLAYLLNPYESHGQGNLFLKKFLEYLGIENPSSTNWVVSAEKGRIDVRLIRNHPHSVIIIENKSNWAEDQPNQLYRYWYYNIHKHKYKIDINDDLYHKRYQVIYLVPNNFKKPAVQSLSRPAEFAVYPDFEILPDKIPVKIISFKKELVEIIESSIKDLSKENNRLREYLYQYLEIINQL